MVELEQRLHCIYRNLGQAGLCAHKHIIYLINQVGHVLHLHFDGWLDVFCSQKPFEFSEVPTQEAVTEDLKPINIPSNKQQ